MSVSLRGYLAQVRKDTNAIILILIAASVLFAKPTAAQDTEQGERYVREDLICPVREDWQEDSDECPCKDGWKPTEERLQQILAAHKKWVEQAGWGNPLIKGRAFLCDADLAAANLEGAYLALANLEGGYFKHASFKGAALQGANLEGADLGEANLKNVVSRRTNFKGTNLHYANLESAVLWRANLTGANLRETSLRGANLTEAEIANARLAGANLTGAIYAPASPPPDAYLEGIQGLATVTFPHGQQSGLVQLRSLLRNAGLQELEREATFAIKHNKALHRRSGESWLERVDGWFKLLFFEWTTGWGLHPQRAVLILVVLMVLLGIAVYPAAVAARLALSSRRHGIFKVQLSEEHESPEGRVGTDEIIITRLSANTTLGAFGYGLWFSLLSAFHIGWRDLNVGTWLSRLQPSAYALRARGWVRVVSGTQSLISVYLIAMWALTYFGRPFG